MKKDSPKRKAKILADAELPSLAPPGRDLTEPLGTCNKCLGYRTHAKTLSCVNWIADPWEAAAEAKAVADECRHFWSAYWLEGKIARRRCQYCDEVEEVGVQ